MKHSRGLWIAIPAIVVVILSCSGDSNSADDDSSGGAGADFNAALYYTKTDSDGRYYQKSEVNGFLTAVYARASQSMGDQTVSSGTATEVALGSLSGSPLSSFELTGTGGIKCLQGGLYIVVGIADFPDNAIGIRAVRLKVNGTATQAVGMLGPNTTGYGWTYVSATEIMYLGAGDIVSMDFTQTSGGSLNLYNHTHLSVAKIAN